MSEERNVTEEQQKAALKEIEDKKHQIHVLLGECEELAEKNGVVFTMSMWGARNRFVPDNATMDEDENTGEDAYLGSEYGYAGWQSSYC